MMHSLSAVAVVAAAMVAEVATEEVVKALAETEVVRVEVRAGEPVAVIVADTYEQARDAAELIMFDVDELPAKIDITRGGETVHAEAPDNCAFDWGMGDEAATEAAFKAAAKTVALDVGDNRIIVNSLEPRGCFAEWDGTRLHLANNGQGVWVHKDNLVKAFGLDEANVRVTNPDTGGAFGADDRDQQQQDLIAET